MIRYIRVARASDQILSIFPAQPVERNCRIPYSGGIDRASYRGTCRTSVSSARNTHEPLVIVTFTERWAQPCMLASCPRASWPRVHSWLVLVKPPIGSGQKPVVLATKQHGVQAPQGPRP